jgi:hypothetical protein
MRAVMTGYRHRNRPRQTRWQDHWQNYVTGKWIDGSGRLQLDNPGTGEALWNYVKTKNIAYRTR